MSDLVEFLRARLDEDAETAQAAGNRHWLEVEAKRRIVDLHGADPHECPVWDEPLGTTCMSYELDCLTLRLFALPYADHPDYDERWKP